MMSNSTVTDAHAEFLAAAAEARSLARTLDSELMTIAVRLWPTLEQLVAASCRVGAAYRALCDAEGVDPAKRPLEHRGELDTPEIPARRIARMAALLKALVYYPSTQAHTHEWSRD